MGIVDAFSAEEKIPMKFSEFYAVVKQAAQYEILCNAIRNGMTYQLDKLIEVKEKQEEP